MEIRIDDLQGAEIAEFLQKHIDDMKAISPPESKHALDINGLRRKNLFSWSSCRNPSFESDYLISIQAKEIDHEDHYRDARQIHRQ